MLKYFRICYNVRMKYGILAYPAGHSLSPVMHNSAFKATGIDATYEVFEVEPLEFDAFMKGLRDSGISGLSVSLPYKEEVMKYLDEISDECRKIGACNTILVRDGKLVGFNTDYIGAVKALTEKVGNLRGKKVILLGAGGAARAILYGIREAGAECVVLNRTVERGEELAKEFGALYGNLDDVSKYSDYDVLINATSALVSGEKCDGFRGVVFDIVYKPLITPLLKYAQKHGCEIITGDKMLLYQAFEQFKIFTREEAPEEVMKKALEERLVY